MKVVPVPELLSLVYQYLLKNANRISFVLVAGCFLTVLILRIYLIFGYQSELGGVESNVIYTILRGVAGYDIYSNPEKPPFSITQYSPLYYYATIGICKVLQITSDQVHEVYVVSRSFSLLCNLIFAAICYWILGGVFRIKGILRWLAGIFSFAYLEVESFSRPDSLYNLFVLLTIWIFLSFLQNKEKREGLYFFVVAASFSIVTLFVKQSGIYLPLILLFYILFFLPSWKHFLLAALVMATTGGLLLWITAGDGLSIFFQNVIGGVNNGISYNWWVKRMLINHLQRENIFDILGLFLGLWYLVNTKIHEHRFLGLCALTMFLFANVTGIKIGSAPNYFTEFLATTFILISIFVHQNKGFVQQIPKIRNHCPLLLLLTFIFTLGLRTLFLVHTYPKFSFITYQTYLANQEVANFLKEDGLAADDLVFTTTHRYDFLNKLLFRNCAFPQKEIVVVNPSGVFDYAAFYETIQSGKLKYFIMRQDGLYEEPGVDENFLGVDFSSFQLVGVLQGYSIYKNPRSSKVE
ncbi:hypothetical protein [Catalinimonas niigatensis]|uniref:hypothetical protein n=1 Tax=Catalinimonas niigatensis TaxID=1397264 RepID=UPI002665A3DB|nr:hypothetical protein [Catalinimonas niigatensis]WPP48043.1 hypothetical protein PZB72_15300 [Catalinimonas niigatensis]